MISIHMTTACRFANGLLQRAVESVLNQDFSDFEFIICDDASEDGTARYLDEVRRQDSRVKIIRNPLNLHSVAISLGRCFSLASDDRPYITWMFDDNVLLPRSLGTLLKAIELDDNLDFVFGATVCPHSDGSQRRIGDASVEYIRANVEQSSVLVPNAGLLAKRSLFNCVGWYDASIILRRSTDWDLFRRMIAAGKFETIPLDMAVEYGELVATSLRNTYTTSFAILKKYCDHRDAAGWPVSLEAALYHPVDRIPAGDWTSEEMQQLNFIMLEYFISVGDIFKAYEWAGRLEQKMEDIPWWVNRLKQTSKQEELLFSKAALGAFTGVVFSHVALRGQRENVECRCGELQAQLEYLQWERTATRYRIADNINRFIKRGPVLHKLLKQAAEGFGRR